MSVKNSGMFNVLGHGFELFFKVYLFVLVFALISAVGNVFEIFYQKEDALLWGIRVVDFFINWLAFLAMYAVFIKGYYRENVNLISQTGVAFKKFFPSIVVTFFYILLLLPGIILISAPTLTAVVGDTIWGPKNERVVWEESHSINYQDNADIQTFYSEQKTTIDDTGKESQISITYQSPKTIDQRSQMTMKNPTGDDIDSMYMVAKLVVVACYLLGIIWFVYISVRFSLVGALIVNQNKSAWEALKNSFRLTKRRWWKTFFIILFASLPTILLSLALSFFAALGFWIAESVFSHLAIPADQVMEIGLLIVQTLLLPLLPAILTVYLEALQPLKEIAKEEAN